MRVCVCVYIHKFTKACIYTCMSTFIYVNIHACMCKHIDIYIYTYIYSQAFRMTKLKVCNVTGITSLTTKIQSSAKVWRR
jgi:hypothetical protein